MLVNMPYMDPMGYITHLRISAEPREVHGESYVYYRYDGGSGISLAYTPGGAHGAHVSVGEENPLENHRNMGKP
jgi:hypothetical protein